MELVLYALLVIAVSLGSFWLAGIVYGLIHRPAIYFPFSLAAKMAVCAVVGSLMLMIGGVVLSTLVFNAEMAKREDYKRWPTLLWGALISISCTALIYFSVIFLAWEVFG